MNTPSLSPSELAWGAFYHQLHLSAMRLKSLMEKSTSANGETREDDPKAEAEANQPIKAGANRVEFSLRKENLSFSHHKEVAKLPPEAQKLWLDKAEKEGW